MSASKALAYVRANNRIDKMPDAVRVTLKASYDFILAAHRGELSKSAAYSDATLLTGLIDKLLPHADRSQTIALNAARRGVNSATNTTLRGTK
jgi:hypothetical protein